MTSKGGLVLLIFTSWVVAPLALTAAVTPRGDQLACPEDAPPLCGIARATLAEAESAVEAAAARRALWSTAAEALRDARGAFVQGDYQAAQHAAGTAIRQARLGIAQTRYPMFPFPNH
jgi:hypothetical protein